MKKSIIGFLCWLLLNFCVGLFIVALVYSVIYPESVVHTIVLSYSIFLMGSLLAILVTAGAYIIQQCPKIDDPVWHGLESN